MPRASTSRSAGQPSNLTDLEANVLGLFRQLGPCSAYRVRKVFEESPTPQWSGSTGAIYPLVKRLAATGALRPGSTSDGRRTKLYSITARGRRRLERWFEAAVDPTAGLDVPADPLRCHVSLLGVLEKKQRAAFLRGAERRLTQTVDALQKRLARNGADLDRFTRLAEEGSLETARVRLRWIRRLRSDLATE